MLPTKNKLHRLCLEYIESFVETVSASEKVISMDQIKNSYGIENPGKILDDYGLNYDPNSPFAFYPVFLGTNNNEISICALCTAILVLDNSKMPMSQHRLRQINSALNTLIVTSIFESKQDADGNYVYWPTTITMFNEVESGTFNQTTMALSTLDKVGFLRKIDGLTEEQIRKRVKLVVESLAWIVAHQIVIGDFGAWSYGVKCTNIEGGEINTAMLPSHFCYETLSKFLKYFISDNYIFKIVNDIDENLIQVMHEACRLFENWTWHNQNDDGGYKMRSDSENSSFIHTCMSHLVYYYCSGYSDFINDENRKKKQFNDSIRYILRNNRNFFASTDEMLEQYKYEYVITTSDTSEAHKIGTKVDTYEIMFEFFYLNNSYKILKSIYKDCITSSQMQKIRELNYIAFERILKKVKKIRIGATNNYFAVEGILLGLATHYPIYCLYNAQVCFLMLLEAEEEKIKLISFPKTRKINLIICIILALVCLGFAIKIGFRDTISSILLSIASYIGIHIISKFFPKLKN